MAYIIERKRSDGSIAYLAQIEVKRNGKRVFRDNRTFDTRPAANAWIKKRQRDVKAAGNDFAALRNKGKTLANAIDRYVDESLREIGRTKAQVLKTIKNYDIADMNCCDIQSHDIVDFAKQLSTSRTPATVSNYLSHLGAVFAVAKPAWGIELNREAIRDAITVCGRLGISGKSRKRERRPTIEELEQLLEHFEAASKADRRAMPMHRVMIFALFSTRRESEITRPNWSDLDDEHRRIFITDMKHPGSKTGNDVWCDLPEPALKVAMSMPRKDNRIFPFNSGTISRRFTQACKFLQIEDLHFHDLRHEGVSRLFEMGVSIPQVAAVSGHRSWSSLQRYTHIRQNGDKYEGWEWIDRVCQ